MKPALNTVVDRRRGASLLPHEMGVRENIKKLKKELPEGVRLVAVSKTQADDVIIEAYKEGHRIFGENKMQEMAEKKERLPVDIEWHMLGHVQTNKIRLIAPFVSLIHSVDSLRLLKEINKHGGKNGRVIDVLLQVFISRETSKQGLFEDEVLLLMENEERENLKNVRIRGLMGIASNTGDEQQIRAEFSSLASLYNSLKDLWGFDILSMGMSGDYKIALEHGSNMLRLGTAVFGERDYNKK